MSISCRFALCIVAPQCSGLVLDVMLLKSQKISRVSQANLLHTSGFFVQPQFKKYGETRNFRELQVNWKK